jgi:MFS family permease
MNSEPPSAETPGALNDADRRRSIAAAITCIAVFAITTGFASPLISLILEARGTDRTTIGAMASVPALAILMTAPFIPTMVRLIGIRPFLYSCITIEFMLFLALPIFDDLTSWFIIRALMGASSSGLWVASEAWISEVTLDRNRGRVMAIYAMILSGSFGLGPLVIVVLGSEGPLPFIIGAGFIATAALPVLWAGKLSPAFEGKATFGVWSFLLIAPTLAGAVWLSSVKEMAFGALLPVYGVRSGLAEPDAATLLTVAALGAVLLQWPIGWLVDRFNRYVTLITCAGVGSCGVAALPWLVATGGTAMWLGLLFSAGIFSGIYTAAMAIVGQRFRGADLVAANAAFGFLWGAGSLTGPVLTGAAMDIWDPHGFPLAITVLSALFVIFAIGRRLQVQTRQT